MIKALILRYVPTEWIAQILGGDGITPIVLDEWVGAVIAELVWQSIT